jgi:hypothetical protein
VACFSTLYGVQFMSFGSLVDILCMVLQSANNIVLFPALHMTRRNRHQVANKRKFLALTGKLGVLERIIKARKRFWEVTREMFWYFDLPQASPYLDRLLTPL